MKRSWLRLSDDLYDGEGTGSRTARRRAGRWAVFLADLVSRRCPGRARDAGPAARFALAPVVGQPITLLSAAAGECA